MIEELIASIIIGTPNFIGFTVAVYTQYKTINRLLDKIDRCDCKSNENVIP